GDQAMGARANLAGFEHHGVAAGERGGQRADAQDHWGIPRRDREHDAGGLPHAIGGGAGAVGGDDFAGDLGGQRSRLAQHFGGQHDVEAGPAGGGAGFGAHGGDEIIGAGL